MNDNRPTSFYLDCALTATTGTAVATGAALHLPALIAAAMAVGAFFLTALTLGALHRFGFSVGQVLLRSPRPRSEQSIAGHALIFTSSVMMTVLYCAGYAMIRTGRVIRGAVRQPAFTVTPVSA